MINIVFSTNPKHSLVLATMQKISSIPAKTSTDPCILCLVFCQAGRFLSSITSLKSVQKFLLIGFEINQ